MLKSRVQVYRNLHKKCWSIRDKKTRKVVCHADTVHLGNCKMHVSEAGRKRVLKEKRKNVHAWIEGDLIAALVDSKGYRIILEEWWPEIKYNPYKNPNFYKTMQIEDVHTAENAFFDKSGRVFAE